MDNVKNAIEWDKSQVCLEEVLVIDPAKVKKAKIMKAYYKYYNAIWVFVLCLVDGAIGSFIVFGIAAKYFWLCIPVFIILFILNIGAIAIICVPKRILNRKIEEVNEESVYTNDFIIFANAVYNLRYSMNDKPFDFFVLFRNRHMMYKLFNLVNIYADQSFLKASAADDTIALKKLLTPFIDKIIEDTVEAYEKHLQIEKDFKNAQERDLNAQIEFDLSIFEKHN